MVWVVIGLPYVVDVVDVVDEVEVEVAVWDVCGHGIVLAVSLEVDAVADVGDCQEERWVVLENVLVLDVAACNGHEVEVVWEMDNHVELDDVVELVAVLGMVAVEHVMGMETSVGCGCCCRCGGSEYGQGYVMAARQVE